ncbi:hypothetical protein IPV08_24100 [Methylobacterium sp. SD274]|uniref:hypothetical protein n=1 Tax=Methylobacterium sp. SD274 TaxID=2782009 RepID=UPI001A96D160|nr:hypothetical protein [Methylobacterium sp. SD274]MBO1023040.1 hypothetical protein [Methylobacterium sp. SD274]
MSMSLAAKAIIATLVSILSLCASASAAILVVWGGVVGSLWVLFALPSMLPSAFQNTGTVGYIATILCILFLLLLVVAVGVASGIVVLMPAIRLLEHWYGPIIRRRREGLGTA